MRDITLGDTVYFNFTTRQFSDGVPTTLLGSPNLSVLEESNVTPITAGVSISVDRAGVAGLNQAAIDATGGNGYEVGKGYCVYISAGTVGGDSVVGEVVAQFTVEAAAVVADVAAAQTDLDTMTDARGEPGQVALPLSATTNLKVDHIYKMLRNRKEGDDGEIRLYDDAGTTVDTKRTAVTAAGVYTEGKAVSGP